MEVRITYFIPHSNMYHTHDVTESILYEQSMTVRHPPLPPHPRAVLSTDIVIALATITVILHDNSPDDHSSDSGVFIQQSKKLNQPDPTSKDPTSLTPCAAYGVHTHGGSTLPADPSPITHLTITKRCPSLVTTTQNDGIPQALYPTLSTQEIQ